ncbi:hypothetical protein HDV01_006707 [Terramyces sp. JEL0728]|nr:hypothetical protein HDV01_006707 [Terramyces sp. JEL0728]
MEKEVKRIFKTDLRFEYHLYLIIKHRQWVPFDKLFAKLGCDDEAKIAKEMRKIPGLAVSEDGRSVTMDLPNFDADAQTIFVPLDHDMDLQLFSVFKVAQTWIDSSSKFAFVTFSVNIEQILDKLEPDVREKIMTKLEWNKRMEEYYLEYNKDIEKPVTPFSVQYQEGIVGYFENVHNETNSKVLRQLFDLAAPVAYIEYNNGNTFGYARFKDPIQADNAKNLFSRVTICQSSRDCKGKIFPFTRFNRGIKLTILEGKEEEEYWEWLNNEREELQTKIVPENPSVQVEIDIKPRERKPKKKSVHLKFDEPEEPRKPRKRKMESIESGTKKKINESYIE